MLDYQINKEKGKCLGCLQRFHPWYREQCGTHLHSTLSIRTTPILHRNIRVANFSYPVVTISWSKADVYTHPRLEPDWNLCVVVWRCPVPHCTVPFPPTSPAVLTLNHSTHPDSPTLLTLTRPRLAPDRRPLCVVVWGCPGCWRQGVLSVVRSGSTRSRSDSTTCRKNAEKIIEHSVCSSK